MAEELSHIPGGSSAENPLAGVTVMVTRSYAQSGKLATPLEAAGARVVPFPVVEQIDPEDWGQADTAIADLEAYDWAVLTSPNAVARFMARLAHQGRDPRASLERVRIAVVGTGTASALSAFGLEPALVPEEFHGEGLADAFAAQGSLEGSRVLLPRAAVARDVVPDALRALGARVDVVPVYRTVRANPDPVGGAALREGAIDIVTFTSPSTFRHFLDVAADSAVDIVHLFARTATASIGPVTSDAMRDRGYQPTVEATESSVPGLVEAVVRWAAGARARGTAAN